MFFSLGHGLVDECQNIIEVLAASDFFVSAVLLNRCKRGEADIKILPPHLGIDVEGHDFLDLRDPGVEMHGLAPGG